MEQERSFNKCIYSDSPAALTSWSQFKMDDHSNSNSNEISMAVNELHALEQKELGNNDGPPSKMFVFTSAVDPVFGISSSRSFENSNQCLTNASGTGLSVQMNSQYCSKIYCPTRRVRHTMPYLRMRPYWVPERGRTRSENNGDHISTFVADLETVHSPAMMDTFDIASMEIVTATSTNHSPSHNLLNSFSNVLVTKVKILKKSKSLEDIRSENLDGSQPSHEMEFVSSRIQKLKVQE